ncbi:hypothetical protein WJX77_005071 [Trebouxia sp. C0004]
MAGRLSFSHCFLASTDPQLSKPARTDNSAFFLPPSPQGGAWPLTLQRPHKTGLEAEIHHTINSTAWQP